MRVAEHADNGLACKIVSGIQRFVDQENYPPILAILAGKNSFPVDRAAGTLVRDRNRGKAKKTL